MNKSRKERLAEMDKRFTAMKETLELIRSGYYGKPPAEMMRLLDLKMADLGKSFQELKETPPDPD